MSVAFACSASAADRAALAEARPVVDHREARRVPLGDGVPGAAPVVDGDDGNEMGEERAGGVEFLAPHDHVVAVVGEAHLITNQPAELNLELFANALGNGASCDSARLRVGNARAAKLKTHFRQLGGFA